MPNCMTVIGLIQALPMGAMGDNRTSMVVALDALGMAPVQQQPEVAELRRCRVDPFVPLEDAARHHLLRMPRSPQ